MSYLVDAAHPDFARDFGDAIRALPAETTVAVDMPIGLTESGPRDCDRVARRLLGWPRRCSVFSAPVRSVLGIGDDREACDAHRAVGRRGMSRQAFAASWTAPRIRDEKPSRVPAEPPTDRLGPPMRIAG